MRIFSNHSKRLLSLGALVLTVVPGVANSQTTYANPICAAGQIPLNTSSTVLAAPTLTSEYDLIYPACATDVTTKLSSSGSCPNQYVSKQSVVTYRKDHPKPPRYTVAGVKNHLNFKPYWTAALAKCHSITLSDPVGWATCTAAQKSAGALNCP